MGAWEWLHRLMLGPAQAGAGKTKARGAARRPTSGNDSGPAHDEAANDPPDPHAVVQVPIEDWIDLHTFAPREVRSVVDEYLRAARAAGFTEVRVVHGRGKGVQRAAVHQVLASHPDVLSFAQAPASRGGWGATVARLRPRRGARD